LPLYLARALLVQDRVKARTWDCKLTTGNEIFRAGPNLVAGSATPAAPQDFTVKNVLQRLIRQGDLFEQVLTHRQCLGEALEALEEQERLPGTPADKRPRPTRKKTLGKTRRGT
jgi:hypothetical protein